MLPRTEEEVGAPLMGAAAPRSDGLPPVAPSSGSLPLPPRPPSRRGSALNLQQLSLPRPDDPRSFRGSRSLQTSLPGADALHLAPPESAASLQSSSRRSSLGATLGGLAASAAASAAPRGAVQGLLPGAYSLPIAQSLEEVRAAYTLVAMHGNESHEHGYMGMCNASLVPKGCIDVMAPNLQPWCFLSQVRLQDGWSSYLMIALL